MSTYSLDLSEVRCEKQKLLPNEFGAEFESDSADLLLAWGNITEKQRKWLERFVRVWNKAEAKTIRSKQLEEDWGLFHKY